MGKTAVDRFRVFRRKSSCSMLFPSSLFCYVLVVLFKSSTASLVQCCCATSAVLYATCSFSYQNYTSALRSSPELSVKFFFLFVIKEQKLGYTLSCFLAFFLVDLFTAPPPKSHILQPLVCPQDSADGCQLTVSTCRV